MLAPAVAGATDGHLSAVQGTWTDPGGVAHNSEFIPEGGSIHVAAYTTIQFTLVRDGSGSAPYEFYLGGSVTCGNQFSGPTSAASWTFPCTGDQIGGPEHFWAAVDGGTTWLVSVYWEATPCGAPDTPGGLVPACGATSVTPGDVTLTWNAVPQASYYRYEVWQNGTCAGAHLWAGNTNSPSFTFHSSAGTTYSWKVQAANNSHPPGCSPEVSSAWSDCCTFTTSGVQGACCNLANGACTVTTQEACADTWLGEDVPCNTTTCPVPPPVGACCRADYWTCTVSTQADCPAPSTWLGAGTDCSPDPCNATVNGLVLDENPHNNIGIGQATVTLTNLRTLVSAATTTDEDGLYRVSVGGGDAYRVLAAHPGYGSESWDLGVLSAGVCYRPQHSLRSRTVVLLHGLNSDHAGMAHLASAINAEGQYHVIADIDLVPPELQFCTPLARVDEQAIALSNALRDRIINQGIRSFDIVAHSMGGLVARRLEQQQSTPGLRRILMLATPNHGSELANEVQNARRAHFLQYGLIEIECTEESLMEPYWDLQPGGQLLNLLNYGVPTGVARENHCCPDCPGHPPETTLRPTTSYITYTAEDYPAPARAPGVLRDWGGKPLYDATDCPNDEIVPTTSVPLAAGNLPNVKNITDRGCGCSNWHAGGDGGEDPGPVTDDPCTDAAIREILAHTGPLEELSICQDGLAGRDDPPPRPGAVVGNEFQMLGGPDSLVSVAAASTSDSLVFDCTYDSLASGLEFFLRDPHGVPMTSDSADVLPNMEYREYPGRAVFTVSDAEPGVWTAVALHGGLEDRVYCSIFVTEYGSVTMLASPQAVEVSPGSPELITALLSNSGTPLLHATVSAWVTTPLGLTSEVPLGDDGAGDDEVADDGLYSGAFEETNQLGRYAVVVAAQGQLEDTGQINRTMETSFWSADHPDLVVLPLSIDLAEIEIGGIPAVRVTGTIRNDGAAAADSIRVFFLERLTQIAFQDTVIAGPGLGGTVTLSGDWMVRTSLSTYDLGVRADVAAGPVEVAFGDNAAYATYVFPLGPCCATNGSCEMTSEADCAGTWLGPDLSCDPNPCPQPIGVCCFLDGSCFVQTAVECGASGGQFLGLYPHCDPNPCPEPEGACCGPEDGTCVIQAWLQCEAWGYAFQGYGTTCDPNPCPLPTGACCYLWSFCHILPPEECYNYGGSWQPAFTTCTPNPCQEWAYPEWGACCNNWWGDCAIMDPFLCEVEMGWQSYGPGTTCDPSPCGTPSEGACCDITTQNCTISGYSYCLDHYPPENFRWLGAGTECDPNPCPVYGACCHPTGECFFTTQADCLLQAGYFQPGEQTCEPNPCTLLPGACCGQDLTCSIVMAAACSDVWVGYGTDCDSSPCSLSACCTPANGACRICILPDCVSPDHWHGDWNACDPNPCPQPARFVCCDLGTGACSLVPDGECGYPNEWHPEWDTCSPNPCRLAACCSPSTGACVLSTAWQCEPPNVWLDDDPSCEPNPCSQPPRAVCCSPFTGECELTIEFDCQSPRIWHNDWSACTPNPCPEPIGACCEPGGTCSMTTYVVCAPPRYWRGAEQCTVGQPCSTGPNAGGVLIVHDTGQAYSAGQTSYPGDPPPSCWQTDATSPPDSARVWKVYAAFPPGNSPRLKGLAFGQTFDPGSIAVLGGGLPDPIADLEIPQGGWPSADGSGVGISFGIVKTDVVAEIYWFGGYGGQGSTWSTAVHPTQESLFVDDAFPRKTDPIIGFGSLGFGVSGSIPCSWSPAAVPPRVSIRPGHEIAVLMQNPYHVNEPIWIGRAGALGLVIVEVFDIQGRFVRRLHEARCLSSAISLSWDCRNANSVSVSSGVYCLRVRSEGSTEQQIFVLAK